MSLFHLLILIISIVFSQSVITRTPSGPILGFTSNYTDTYLGIRYGQISKRWSLATLPEPWTNTLTATTFGPICHQYGPFKQPMQPPENEDCLFLNIWVPERNDTLLPVRVWLHGGGYAAGYSNDYDGENLAYLSKSIIVTINYRLGFFGFFSLPNINVHNLGWTDQQLALRWVQENIESFGGDKTNVMLFGQSAGGGSVLAHLIMESSRPLYSSVILQSAGPYHLANCKENAKKNFELLETTFPQCQSNLTCFQELDAATFYQELKINWIKLWACIGEQSQLLEQPITLIRKGLFNKNANVLGGFNSNEGQSATLLFNQYDITISSSKYRELAEQYEVPSELTDRYDPTTTDKNYFNAFTWLIGDYLGHCPNFFLFNHLATISPSSTYAYFFIHPTENWMFSPLHFNATHITEIPYVFQTNFGMAHLTPAEINLSTKLINYFTLFHSSKQPWTSYKNNQTILIFDIDDVNTGKGIRTQSGFEKELIERCSITLKYFDSDDCHAYLTQQDCSNINHCQWLGDRCDIKPTSSAQQHQLSFLTFFYLINFFIIFLF